jgi:hypothetical protein
VWRSWLGEHRAVVAQGGRLGTEDELDVLEPGVRERAERRRTRGGLSRRLLVVAAARGGALGLDRLDELDHAAAGLVLGQVARRRPAAPRAPTARIIADEPGVRAEPAANPLAVRAAPLDRPHRLPGSLVVSTSRKAVDRGS